MLDVKLRLIKIGLKPNSLTVPFTLLWAATTKRTVLVPWREAQRLCPSLNIQPRWLSQEPRLHPAWEEQSSCAPFDSASQRPQLPFQCLNFTLWTNEGDGNGWAGWIAALILRWRLGSVFPALGWVRCSGRHSPELWESS